MLNPINRLEHLFEKVEDYGKTSFELYKLKSISKSTEVISTFVSRGAFAIVLSMFLIFASIALALWLGELLGKSYYGFLSVAGLYILLGVIIYFVLHKAIKRKVSNSIISEIFNQ